MREETDRSNNHPTSKANLSHKNKLVVVKRNLNPKNFQRDQILRSTVSHFSRMCTNSERKTEILTLPTNMPTTSTHTLTVPYLIVSQQKNHQVKVTHTRECSPHSRPPLFNHHHRKRRRKRLTCPTVASKSSKKTSPLSTRLP